MTDLVGSKTRILSGQRLELDKRLTGAPSTPWWAWVSLVVLVSLALAVLAVL